jgi:RHS repeat-associated protein
MGTWGFQYDAVDRLTSAAAAGGNPVQYAGNYTCWAWNYDSFGNRTLEAFSAAPCTGANQTPQVEAFYGTTNTNNRIQSISGNILASFSYDASGNTLYDGNNEYWYDAEGQLCAVQSQRYTGAAVIQYIYDAEGARIGKGTLASAPSSYTATCAPPLGSGFTLTARYLVDLGGDQVTELSEQGLPTPQTEQWQHSNVWAAGKLTATYDYNYGQGGIHFELADPLGTKRVQANALGQTDEQCTSLPFGNDINNPPNLAGTSCTFVANSLSTADDATEHHFTQKERDTETGNDYFFARYYSSALGRFTTPDWSAKVEPVPYAVMGDPQSLNLYAYVRNNPLSRVDLDGHCQGFECQMMQDWIAQHQITNLTDKEVANAGLVRLGTAQQQKNQLSGGGGVSSLLGMAQLPSLPSSLEAISRAKQVYDKGGEIQGTLHDKEMFSYWGNLHRFHEIKLQQDLSGMSFADSMHQMVDKRQLVPCFRE